jgi:Arylsulfotransferase (ASST)
MKAMRHPSEDRAGRDACTSCGRGLAWPHECREAGSRLWLIGLLALATASALAMPVSAAASTGMGSAASYVSASALRPLNVSVQRGQAARSGGLIFIDPFASGAKPLVGQPGALILDRRGQPEWFHPVPKTEQVVDFRAQRYVGKPVLTWWQGTVAVAPRQTNIPTGSPEPGARFYVYDDHYRRLKTIAAAGSCAQITCWTADLHEFLLSPSGNALFLAARTVPMDLTPYGGTANGALEDSAVQEIDLKTGRLLFQWDMLQHVPLSEAQTKPPPRGVWDPYHLNSLQANSNGNLLVSARNTWAVYEIARSTGNVAWQLGGRGSSFTLSPQAQFFWQHDAQLHKGGELSLFDDGCCAFGPRGFEPAEQEAHGLLVQLNAASHTATVVHEYRHNPPLHVPSQGNAQMLADGNVFVGWGQLPYYSEYTADGRLIYDVALPEADESYRAFRLPWRGMPLTRPSVAAVRHGGRTTVWVSWNGATQAARWRVLAGASRSHLRPVALAHRGGFETRFTLNTNGPLFEVQALSVSGHVIGASHVLRAGHNAHIAHALTRGRGRASSRFKGALVPGQTATIHAGAVAVHVSCPAGSYRRCAVKLTLRTAKPVKVGSRSEVLTLGTGSAMILPGRMAPIRVRLSAQALKLIGEDHGRLQPEASAVSRDGRGHSATRSQRITLAEPGHAPSSEEPSSLY